MECVAQVLGVTGDDGVLVIPNPATGNINLLGLTVINATHAKPVFTEAPLPTLYTEKIDVQVSASAASANINNAGLSSFLNTQFTVDPNTGFVQITNFSPFNYRQISANYTIDASAPPSDYYLSCDSSGGAFTIKLLDAPTLLYRRFIIKDRTGNASGKNITISSVTGAVLIDGATSYIMAGNFDSIEFYFGTAQAMRSTNGI